MIDTENAITRMVWAAAHAIHLLNEFGGTPCGYFLRSIGKPTTRENRDRVSDAVKSAVRSELEAFAKENKIKQEAV